jgi:hypothetical protein
MTAPVMNEPQSLARSIAMRVMSSMRPRRRSGTRCVIACSVSSTGGFVGARAGNRVECGLVSNLDHFDGPLPKISRHKRKSR